MYFIPYILKGLVCPTSLKAMDMGRKGAFSGEVKTSFGSPLPTD
jgi:hypothetical protein